MPEVRIGLLISSYYIGYGIGAFAYDLPDRIGRKKSCIYGFLLCLLCETMILFNSNYYVRLVGFFGIGLSQVKNSTAYNWLSESVSMKDKSTAYTIINIVDSIPLLVICLYIMFVSTNWFHLNFWIVCVGYSALIIACFCPESPQWLLISGRRKECIRVFNRIAKCNGSWHRISKEQQFVEDPANLEKLDKTINTALSPVYESMNSSLHSSLLEESQ